MGVGKIRFYNGPQSPLMDKIYDDLIEHIDVPELPDWPIISLHLARIVGGIKMGAAGWSKCLLEQYGYSDPYGEDR
jgi:hypothetical protein